MTSDFRRHWQVALATLLIWCSAGLLGSIVQAADDNPAQGERSRISGDRRPARRLGRAGDGTGRQTWRAKVASRGPMFMRCASSSRRRKRRSRCSRTWSFKPCARSPQPRRRSAASRRRRARLLLRKACPIRPARRSPPSPSSSRRSPAASSGFRRRWMRCTAARRTSRSHKMRERRWTVAFRRCRRRGGLGRCRRGRGRDAAGVGHGRQVRAFERGRTARVRPERCRRGSRGRSHQSRRSALQLGQRRTDAWRRAHRARNGGGSARWSRRRAGGRLYGQGRRLSLQPGAREGARPVIAAMLERVGCPRDMVEVLGNGENNIPEPTPDGVAEPLNRSARIFVVADNSSG